MNLYYRKADEILPPELIEEIYKYFRGGCLYVSHRKRVSRIKRNLEIIGMRREGKTITEIAERFLITRRAVRYILQKAEGKSAAPRSKKPKTENPSSNKRS